MRRHALRELTAVLALTLLMGGAAGAGPGAQEGAGTLASEASPLAAHQARVILKPVVQVDGGAVTLADVARFEAPPELVERLERVPVGPAPLPGRSRWVDTGYLAVRLRQAGLDPQAIRLEGPERIELVRVAASASEGASQPSAPGGQAAAGVTRGQTVVLEAVAGPVAVQVSARVLRSAQVGDRVPVLNLSSGREVEAVVVGPGRVRAEVGL